MISRHWRALAHRNRAKDYVEHLRCDTFPALQDLNGFIDASVLSRDVTEGVEFLVVTRWASLEAIASFAGPQLEAAVVPAEAAAMMIEYDHRVKHFEVLDWR
jgi:heme-degrading monooxygenase HmoA